MLIADAGQQHAVVDSLALAALQIELVPEPRPTE